MNKSAAEMTIAETILDSCKTVTDVELECTQTKCKKRIFNNKNETVYWFTFADGSTIAITHKAKKL